jgi:hypothetical protein
LGIAEDDRRNDHVSLEEVDGGHLACHHMIEEYPDRCEQAVRSDRRDPMGSKFRRPIR